ncbi:hypothetical protein PROFUN_08190 [Planoprotostelium fungivorum]|uniref:Vesicle transport protein USE1 n=1 Tax=Planoprotostelium fungivorum TaxID=1890364 RepID=A0A2P6N650_9EUKA|nr:hypothetical protein PROFUN_13502 [Planoprotostelium fungivorum]PRP79429.1 hypothetical protein PROFUN_08190 [Planoprotostelium fungivorum]
MVVSDNRKEEVNFRRLLERTERLRDAESSRFSDDFVKKLHDNGAQMSAHSDYQKRLTALDQWRDRGQNPTHSELTKELFSMQQDNELNETKREEDEQNTSVVCNVTMDFMMLKYVVAGGSQLRQRTEGQRSNEDNISGHDIYQEVMEKNRRKQEVITDEMAEISGVMKESARWISEAMTKDNKNLDGLSKHVDHNLEKIKVENNRLRLHSKMRFSWTLTYWMMMMIVGVIFMATYMFMKIVPKPR